MVNAFVPSEEGRGAKVKKGQNRTIPAKPSLPQTEVDRRSSQQAVEDQKVN